MVAQPMTRPGACCILLLAALCWGAGNVASKTVLDHLGPLTVTGLRCLLAALVIAPFGLSDLRNTSPGWAKSALGVSALFTVALVLQQMAYRFTSVTNVSFLVNTATVLTPVLGWLALGHRVSLAVACAAPLTLFGALMMAGGANSLTRMNSGDLLCLGSAMAYAGWMVALSQHAVVYRRPLGTTLLQFCTGAAAVLPLALWDEAPSLGLIVQAAPELLTLGLFSTALAFGLQTWAQRYVPAATAAVLVSTESMFGAAGAYLLLGEQTAVLGLAGAAVILSAIAIVAFGDRISPLPDIRPQCKPLPPTRPG
jgi:drug/metabolite transporter (DMT)-like permease